jgi:hypothetical protein
MWTPGPSSAECTLHMSHTKYGERSRQFVTPRTSTKESTNNRQTSVLSPPLVLFFLLKIPPSLCAHLSIISSLERSIETGLNVDTSAWINFAPRYRNARENKKELADAHSDPYPICPPSSGFIPHRTQLWKGRVWSDRAAYSALGTVLLRRTSLLCLVRVYQSSVFLLCVLYSSETHWNISQQ